MGEKQKQWQILSSWAPKSLWMVTAAWNSKMLALWKKSCDKPRYCMKKQKHHFADKGPYSESYGFSSSRVWMWELDHKEGWATKNWCFWIVVLKKTLESPLDSRRSNQSILKEISPEYSLEGLMLKLQYFGYLRWTADSLEKTLMLGKIEVEGEGDDRGWDGWMASPTQWTWVWANSRRWWRTGKPGMLQSMVLQRAGHNWATEQHQKVLQLKIRKTNNPIKKGEEDLSKYFSKDIQVVSRYMKKCSISCDTVLKTWDSSRTKGKYVVTGNDMFWRRDGAGIKGKSEALQETGTLCVCSVGRPYLTLCDPMNYCPSGSSVHGIF